MRLNQKKKINKNIIVTNVLDTFSFFVVFKNMAALDCVEIHVQWNQVNEQSIWKRKATLPNKELLTSEKGTLVVAKRNTNFDIYYSDYFKFKLYFPFRGVRV